MALQTFDLPLASERAKFSEVQLRRHSSGEAYFGYNKENVISRYLRASSGSCHDLCKIGNKTAFEANDKHSTSRRASLHSKPMKMPTANRRMSIDSRLPISCTADTHKLELPTKSSDSKKQRGKEVLENRNNASLVKAKPLFLSKSNVSSITKTTSQSKTTSKKKETISKSTSGRAKTTSKSTFEVRATELSKKPVIFLNPNTVALKTIPSMDSSESIGGQRSTKIKMEKREGSREVVSPSRASLSSKPSPKINAGNHNSLKIVSRVKNQPEARRVEPKKLNDDVEEKTLYVINVESDNQTSQSDQNGSQDIEPSPEFSSSVSQSISQSDQEKTEYSTVELDEDSSSGNCEAEYIDNKDSLKVQENGNPQKGETVFLEYKECQMLKLKMVGGKLVETQFEKISPKKLKFRRGKMLQENATNVNIDDITDSEKVNLRHLEVEGKKDEEILLNNVIEETASKLVKCEKGKVQALVNAFEAIISLQEKNVFDKHC
ncbi:hypothetical protein TanjilG_15708 [Lupinus angustifolius]|uniref:Calmodulin-binding domain-containing protein n=1 Tax=Lupinus angustifolius TaxID=3871 RepID=A0A1J7GN38_LUPAN|nr:PREDICTED: uncharacterized protein LOC109360152 [Lupinus angustifolius]OIW01844.1 hypothetical protein TanjilG_15708 [Lupinus angustifolius]